MGLSLPHLLLVLVIVLLVFGAGRLPRVMGDIGKGIRSLREGLKGDEAPKIEDKSPDKITDKTEH
jgi:sec-independent protein translocase protein TatA